MIDKNSPLPLYYQLEELLKKAIESKEFNPGDFLPSERELSKIYQISRMTVRQAVMNLVKKGYLTREKGRGTFVSNQKLEQNMKGLTSFTEEMQARQLVPESKLLYFKISPVQQNLQDRLNLEAGELIYTFTRLRLANGEPIALETSYLPVNLVPGLTKEILEQSLYFYIEENLGLKIGHATQTVEASLADEEEMKYLNIKKGMPVLIKHRETFINNGTQLELVRSAYRADKYKYIIDMDRK
ncbi:GntR family transcriptional regulator [Bacillus sp. SA1-12]|uniref:GntR family transcriptional regulator n=1 Tax=Bacillus sp. SA1-12 TaxID=1455638 RepID=UPI000626F80B|nr:GntR family transcriptional regulator [Bacillus sp. SA1-12]KKI90882.1 GntR family transcriptional regulator [Bacillus sp. SA1-12]